MIEIVREELVDLTGIEPVTSSMPWKRAPSCATGPLSGRTFSILRPAARFVNRTAVDSPPKDQLEGSRMLRIGYEARTMTAQRTPGDCSIARIFLNLFHRDWELMPCYAVSKVAE
jgi:hypothetical protein